MDRRGSCSVSRTRSRRATGRRCSRISATSRCAPRRATLLGGPRRPPTAGALPGQVMRCKMACLEPGVWLNDEVSFARSLNAPLPHDPRTLQVINIFFKILGRRERDAAAAGVGGVLNKCHFHNTQFYAKLAHSNKGYFYPNVKRWTREAPRRSASASHSARCPPAASSSRAGGHLLQGHGDRANARW